MILFVWLFLTNTGYAKEILCYTEDEKEPVKPCSTMSQRPCPVGYVSNNFNAAWGESCYRLTQKASWESVIGQCRDPLISDGSADHEEFQFDQWLQKIDEVLWNNDWTDGTFWLPARRHLEGAPIYSHLTLQPPKSTGWITDETLQQRNNSVLLDHRKCLVLKRKGTANEISTVDCNESHHGLCLYKQPLSNDTKITSKVCSTISSFVMPVGDLISHSCPVGWKTHRLIPGRNRCFKMFSGKKVTWKEAAKVCLAEGGQLATLERYDVYSVVYGLTNSSGLFGRSWVGLKERESVPNLGSPVFCWIEFNNSTCLPTRFAPFRPVEEVGCKFRDEDIYGALDSDGFLTASSESVKLDSFICEKRVKAKPKHRLQLSVEQSFQEVVRLYVVNPSFDQNQECDVFPDSVRFPGQACEKGLRCLQKGIRCYRNGLLLALTSPRCDGSFELDSSTEPSIYSCEYWFEPKASIKQSNILLRNFEATYAVRLKLNMPESYGELSEKAFFESMALTRMKNGYCRLYVCNNKVVFVAEFVNFQKTKDQLNVNLLITRGKDNALSNSIVSDCSGPNRGRSFYCFLRVTFFEDPFSYTFNSTSHKEYSAVSEIRNKTNCVIQHQTFVNGDSPRFIVKYVCTTRGSFVGVHVLPSFGCPEITERNNITSERHQFPETEIHQMAIESDICGNRTDKFTRRCEGSEVYGARWGEPKKILDATLHQFCTTEEDDETTIQLKNLWEEMTNRSTTNMTKLLEITQTWKPSIGHIQILANILQKIKYVGADGLRDGFEILSKKMAIDSKLLAECQKFLNFAEVCSVFEDTLKNSRVDNLQEDFTCVNTAFAHATVAPNESKPIFVYVYLVYTVSQVLK